MSIRIDTSTQLVWAIANTEANLAGDTRIQPIHFFLGILKVIDPQFLRQLEGVELADEDRRHLIEVSKNVRQYLELSVNEVTNLRRSLRRGLRDGGAEPSHIHMLHRADESRAVFKAAAEKVANAGGQTLSALGLTEALFETDSISLEGMKKLKSRPSTRGARWEVVNEKDKKGSRYFEQWYGRNLSRLAAEQNLPPFVGRESEIRAIVRSLSRTSRRHVAILGASGIGKTALAEGVAKALVSRQAGDALAHVEILEIHGSDIASDCGSEAEASKRLARLFSIVGRNRSAVLFVDDLHGVFPAHLKPEGVLARLTTILSDGVTPVITATTPEQWETLVTKAPSFSRHFHVLKLGNPPASDCRRIAEEWATKIGAMQHVAFTPEAVSAVIVAAEKLPSARGVPDRLVDLLENAATFVKVSALSSKSAMSEVKPGDVASMLAEHYGVKSERAPRSVSET